MPRGAPLPPTDGVEQRRAGSTTSSALGWAAVAVAVAGLAAAVLVPMWIDPPSRTLRDELAGLLTDAARRRHELDSAAYHAALRTWERIAAALGFVAIVLAVIAGIRKQHRLLVVLALGLGTLALLWTYIAAALFAALVLMVIAMAST